MGRQILSSKPAYILQRGAFADCQYKRILTRHVFMKNLENPELFRIFQNPGVYENTTLDIDQENNHEENRCADALPAYGGIFGSLRQSNGSG